MVSPKALGKLILILCVALSAKVLLGATEEESKFLSSRCGGGDGPKPMVDISKMFPSYAQLIPTDGEVREFVAWEKRDRIVYRNDGRQIFVTTKDGQKKGFLSNSAQPLSRVVDNAERFLLTESNSWLLDTWAPGWFNFKTPYARPNHLFWNGDRLYSASYVSGNPSEIRFMSYRVGDKSAKRVCRTLTFFMADGFKLGEGHSYPYAVLYRTQRETKGLRLTVAVVDVSNCTAQEKTYADLLEGPVENVYWFQDLRSVLVKVNHPTKQLVWDTGNDSEHCHYYTIANSRLLVLNYKHPVVGLYDPKDGLSLLYMHDLDNKPPKSAHVLSDLGISDLQAGDVRLLRDGKTMIAAPRIGYSGRKVLMKIEMPNSPLYE